MTVRLSPGARSWARGVRAIPPSVRGIVPNGSDGRDMMLEADEKRFGNCRAPEPIELLSDNGSPYTAREPDLRRSAWPEVLLHTDRQPREQRRIRSSRQNHQARLRQHQRLAKRRGGIETDRGLVRRLQREPSALSAQNALATRVHQGFKETRLTVRSNGGKARKQRHVPGDHPEHTWRAPIGWSGQNVSA